MIRVEIWLLVLSLGASAFAQTRAQTPRAATQPSSEQLHRQAIELMNVGEYPAARGLFDKLYRATPDELRTRSMVLNRAIADLSQSSFAMRAVRDVSQYLLEHKEDDELATNLLAAALNATANEARLKRGTVWQRAYAEWERRDAILDKSRPGFRRWGAGWITDEQYVELRELRREVEQAIREQQKRVDEARSRISAAQARRFDGGGIVEMENDPFASAPIRPVSMTSAEVAEYEHLRATDWKAAWKYYSDFRARKSRQEQKQWDRERFKSEMRMRRQEQADASYEQEIREQISDAELQLGVEMYELRMVAQQRPRPQWATKFEAVEP